MGSSWRRSCNQNELLRVLCASKTSTRRTRRLSVTSVFGLFSATENTEKRAWQDNTVPRTSATARPPAPTKHLGPSGARTRKILAGQQGPTNWRCRERDVSGVVKKGCGI